MGAQQRTGQNPGPLRLAVVGGAFSGNKGAAGMLESLIDNIRPACRKDVIFDVISVYPGRDAARPLPGDVRLVPAPPVLLVIVLPLAAMFYMILGALRLPRRFLRRWSLLDAVAGADLLADISGISFVDGRAAALAYNLACSIPAFLCGTPVVRLAQAMGPLRSPLNRAAARFTLLRCRAVFARGPETARHLESAGIGGYRRAADLAFALPDGDGAGAEFEDVLPPGEGPLIGIAPSQVLADRLRRSGGDLAGLLASALDEAVDRAGARVLVIAHSWLGPERRSRNNDYHICRDLLGRMKRRDRAVFIERDLSPGELRAVIARCDCFVACRFHAMISALSRAVPCVVPSWSHKYGEVMDEFGLGRMVIDAGDLTAAGLSGAIADALDNGPAISGAIRSALPRVQASARSQMEYLAGELCGAPLRLRRGGIGGRLYRDIYKEIFGRAWLGYAADPAVRSGAASGGLVSTLLAGMLEEGAIDGAIACRTSPGTGGVRFETVMCRTREEILSCRTSIYSDFNHAKGIIDILRRTPGRFAAVALPCQWRWIEAWLDRDPQYADRLALRVGLWCGHATHRRLLDDLLDIAGIDQRTIERLSYRTGLWRGETVIGLRGGAERRFPFSGWYGLYQNLYVDCMGRCLSCEDHFAERADISFGDAWLTELRGGPVKYSMAVAMTARGAVAADGLASSPAARLSEVAPELAVRAQKRAVIWHTHGTAGRARLGGLFGTRVRASGRFAARWNDIVSAAMILGARRCFAGRSRRVLLRLPRPLHYAYMLAQKAFLNF